MAKLKHIAITTQDVEATAKFYVEVLGLEKVGDVSSPNATGCYLSDGNVNIAILNFKNEAAAGAEFGTGYSGIHHIGFEVESLGEISGRLQDAGSTPRDDINQALKLQMGGPRHANVEVKYRGPDNVIIDVSETGWVGTHGLEAEPAKIAR
jgi:catechol 2,3-dioxygenase-like lactoylglutathione lyase family enzyme